MRKVKLPVSDTKGNLIEATIKYMPVEGKAPLCIVELPYIKEVARDKPPFAKRGRIRFGCRRSEKAGILNKVTKYLESLFLKELENESTDTSIGDDNQPGRVEEEHSGGFEDADTGEDPGSIRDS